MRILVTNDDGIHAEGLAVLERVAAQISADVVVVAPEYDQSGVAHSLSLNDPLRLRAVGPNRYAVKGTPTDCVIMGVHHILKGEKPDLVLSGVNRGLNAAEDVSYSGTIAGAIEGTLIGVPSVALSQGYPPGGREQAPFSCAEAHAPAIIDRILAEGVPPGVLINVNFPPCQPDEVAGVSVCVQGRRAATSLRVEERQDGRRIPYYWIGFSHARLPPPPGTDIAAIAAGRIALTPLRVDLTDEPTVTRYARAFG
jgi:5'-nucleotidase